VNVSLPVLEGPGRETASGGGDILIKEKNKMILERTLQEERS